MASDNQHNDYEDQHDHGSSNNRASASSNQNLILGIVMGAVVLLLLLMVINQQFLKDSEGSSKDTVDEKLARELATEEARLEELQKISLVGGQSPQALADSIMRDTATLRQLVDDSINDRAARQASDRALSAANQRLMALQNQVDQYAAAAGRVPGLENRIKLLQDQLSGSVDRTLVDSLRQQMKTLKEELDRLRTKMTGMVDRADYDRLQEEIKELRGLRAEVQRLRAREDAAKLFVTKDRLSPRASALFRELERLEGNTRAGLEIAYDRIEQDFKARPVEAATFATGSADLASEHESHLRGVIDRAPNNSFFLVVGYASKSGDSESNEKLSSRRATRTASVVNYMKKAGHEVQAVYLGETDRFGTDMAPNQVCEVWEIRP